MRRSFKGIVCCDASGVLMWDCTHCDKRIFSLYKGQLEANIMAHLRTHEKELAKSAMRKVRRV